jgi:hypothetical protein
MRSHRRFNPLWWAFGLCLAAADVSAGPLPYEEALIGTVRLAHGDEKGNETVVVEAPGSATAGYPQGLPSGGANDFRAAASAMTQTLRAKSVSGVGQGDRGYTSAQFISDAITPVWTGAGNASIGIDLRLDGRLFNAEGGSNVRMTYQVFSQTQIDPREPAPLFSFEFLARSSQWNNVDRNEGGRSLYAWARAGGSTTADWQSVLADWTELGPAGAPVLDVNLDTGLLQFVLGVSTNDPLVGVGLLETWSHSADLAITDFSNTFDTEWRALDAGLTLVGQTPGVFDPLAGVGPSGVPEPATVPLFALAAGLLGFTRRRGSATH